MSTLKEVHLRHYNNCIADRQQERTIKRDHNIDLHYSPYAIRIGSKLRLWRKKRTPSCYLQDFAIMLWYYRKVLLLVTKYSYSSGRGPMAWPKPPRRWAEPRPRPRPFTASWGVAPASLLKPSSPVTSAFTCARRYGQGRCFCTQRGDTGDAVLRKLLVSTAGDVDTVSSTHFAEMLQPCGWCYS